MGSAFWKAIVRAVHSENHQATSSSNLPVSHLPEPPKDPSESHQPDHQEQPSANHAADHQTLETESSVFVREPNHQPNSGHPLKRAVTAILNIMGFGFLLDSLPERAEEDMQQDHHDGAGTTREHLSVRMTSEDSKWSSASAAVAEYAEHEEIIDDVPGPGLEEGS